MGTAKTADVGFKRSYINQKASFDSQWSLEQETPWTLQRLMAWG